MRARCRVLTEPESGGDCASADFEDFSMLEFTLPAPAAAAAGIAAGDPSGTEAREPRGLIPVVVTRVEVPADQHLPPIDTPPPEQPEAMRALRLLVAQCEAQVQKLMGVEIGRTAVPLQVRERATLQDAQPMPAHHISMRGGRQAKKFMLRTQETNVGNLLADAFLAELQPLGAECALLIGGIISSHAVVPPGEFTLAVATHGSPDVHASGGGTGLLACLLASSSAWVAGWVAHSNRASQDAERPQLVSVGRDGGALENWHRQ